MSATIKSISVAEEAEMFGPGANERLAVLRKELADWQKCVKGEYFRLCGLTQICAIDGHRLDAGNCAPIEKALLKRVMADFVSIVLEGRPITGGQGNWSCGFMGSRWLDMDASKYDLDYIRVAFYSRKHFKDNWTCDKPYIIQITCEKGKHQEFPSDSEED